MYSQDQMAALVTARVTDYLRLGERAGLNVTNLAELAGVSKVTLHNWRREPPTSTSAYNFVNILAATKLLRADLESGRLPAKNRSQARRYVEEKKSPAVEAGQSEES